MLLIYKEQKIDLLSVSKLNKHMIINT